MSVKLNFLMLMQSRWPLDLLVKARRGALQERLTNGDGRIIHQGVKTPKGFYSLPGLLPVGYVHVHNLNWWVLALEAFQMRSGARQSYYVGTGPP